MLQGDYAASHLGRFGKRVTETQEAPGNKALVRGCVKGLTRARQVLLHSNEAEIHNFTCCLQKSTATSCCAIYQPPHSYAGLIFLCSLAYICAEAHLRHVIMERKCVSGAAQHGLLVLGFCAARK